MAQSQYKNSLSGFIWQSFLAIGLLYFIALTTKKIDDMLHIGILFSLCFVVCGLLVLFLAFRLLFPPTSVQAVEDVRYWQEIAEERQQEIGSLQAQINECGQINSKGHQVVAELKQVISNISSFAADLEQNNSNERQVIAKWKHENHPAIVSIISYLNENLREVADLRNGKLEYQKNYEQLSQEKIIMSEDFVGINFIRKNFGEGKKIADLLTSKNLENLWLATDSIRKALAAKGIENPNKLKVS